VLPRPLEKGNPLLSSLLFNTGLRCICPGQVKETDCLPEHQQQTPTKALHISRFHRPTFNHPNGFVWLYQSLASLRLASRCIPVTQSGPISFSPLQQTRHESLTSWWNKMAKSGPLIMRIRNPVIIYHPHCILPLCVLLVFFQPKHGVRRLSLKVRQEDLSSRSNIIAMSSLYHYSSDRIHGRRGCVFTELMDA